MAWSNDITDLVLSGVPLNVSYKLYARNGYKASRDEAWTEIPLITDGWTLVTTDSDPVVSSATFELGMMDFSYFDEFDHDNDVQLWAGLKLECTVTYFDLSTETGIIYRGLLHTKQIVDSNLIISSYDLIGKIKTSLVALDFEADLVEDPASPGVYIFADVALVHASNWDATGEEYTFEIDRIVGYSWAFDHNIRTRSRRVWRPGTYIIERDIGAGYVEVPASEYYIDTALGLVRFYDDQAGGYVGIRVQTISVYEEGTLELVDILESLLLEAHSCCEDLIVPGEIDSDCLGMGGITALLRNTLSGTMNFVADSSQIVGAGGTDFHNELSVDDRVSPDGIKYGVVASIEPGLETINLKYPYKGANDPGATAFKSTLKASDLSLTNYRWNRCEGNAAECYRDLQTKYADSKGYKVWFDHYNNQIKGQRVVIKEEDNADFTLGPIGSLTTTLTTEDFASAVQTTGVSGRSKNLMTQAGTVLDIVAAAPALGYGLQAGYTTWGVISWSLLKAGNEAALADLDMNVVNAVYYLSTTGALEDITYRDFVKIDLGAEYELEKIVLYNLPYKNAGSHKQGFTITGSLDDVTYTQLTPETTGIELGHNEEESIDLEDSSPVRYLMIACRGIKWGVSTNNEKVMGLREILIYGTSTICVTACNQSCIPYGYRGDATGTITFNAGGPPYTVTGAGTNFGGAGEPIVGSAIALTADLDSWAIIETINAPTGANCVELVYPYSDCAAVPVGPGAFKFTNNDPPYIEGEGGHFLGGEKHDDSGTATASAANQITDGGKAWITDEWSNSTLRILDGLHPGDYLIIGNTPTVLNVVGMDNPGLATYVVFEDNFIVDWVPDLVHKMFNITHQTQSDESGLVLTDVQAKDRAFLLLDEMRRLYRLIVWSGLFDPRISIFDTVKVIDDRRDAGSESLYYLVQALTRKESQIRIEGTEFSAGIAE